MSEQTNKVVEAVKERLQGEQATIRLHLELNKKSMKTLALQQTLLKRELAVLGRLIRSLEPPKEKEENACAKS